VNVSGADDAPTLGAVTSGSVAEIDQSSSTTDAGLSGTLVGADVDVETLTYGSRAARLRLGYRRWSGPRTLTVDTATGAYSYARTRQR